MATGMVGSYEICAPPPLASVVAWHHEKETVLAMLKTQANAYYEANPQMRRDVCESFGLKDSNAMPLGYTEDKTTSPRQCFNHSKISKSPLSLFRTMSLQLLCLSLVCLSLEGGTSELSVSFGCGIIIAGSKRKRARGPFPPPLRFSFFLSDTFSAGCLSLSVSFVSLSRELRALRLLWLWYHHRGIQKKTSAQIFSFFFFASLRTPLLIYAHMHTLVRPNLTGFAGSARFFLYMTKVLHEARVDEDLQPDGARVWQLRRRRYVQTDNQCVPHIVGAISLARLLDASLRCPFKICHSENEKMI